MAGCTAERCEEARLAGKVPALPPIQLTEGYGGLPPYPGLAIVPHVVLPDPPQLNPGLLDWRRVEVLVRAYRGAVHARLGIQGALLPRRALLERSAAYEKLVEAAMVIIREQLPPAGWAAFSCEVWRDYGPEGAEEETIAPACLPVRRPVEPDADSRQLDALLRQIRQKAAAPRPPPPVTWVFMTSRMEQHAAWYRGEAESYGGGLVVFGPSAKELMARYRAMALAVQRSPSRGEAAVRAIVAEHFPGDTYATLLGRARAEADEHRTRLVGRLRRGDFLW
jgi:hypothetical protein